MSQLPRDETFIGFDGPHTFTITQIPVFPEEGAEYGVEAQDQSSGYRIGACGPSLEAALEKLKEKIKAEISVQYLVREGDRWSLRHDKLRGRVTVGGNFDLAALVVDGHFISGEELLRLLTTYEGNCIEITLSSPME
ncbi:MAG: hypothetical protein KJ077_07630 [Anaerolineae bacterium]|nr:hypothetical protein [Anaerolineae bacterium]